MTTLRETLAAEARSEHCKVYAEPTLKSKIQKYADRKGMTFSEAGRELWLDALERKGK